MRTRTLAIAACCSVLGACATMIGPADAFRLTSPGMSDDEMMAPKMAGNFKKNPNCTGDNISPALEWSYAPAKTRSFALIVVDQAGRNGLGVSHGVVYGIPANVTSLAEGALAGTPTVGVGGSNTLNMPYVGPCTPRNTSAHHYVFTLIATDLEPNALRPGLKQDELLKSLDGGHALSAASLALRFAQ